MNQVTMVKKVCEMGGEGGETDSIMIYITMTVGITTPINEPT